MKVLSTYSFFTRRILWLVAICLTILLSACDDDDVCEEITANNLRVGFYQVGQEDAQSWATVDSLMVHSLEKPDDPVHDTLYTVSSLELPLNIHASSCVFVIDFFHAKDTLWLYYNKETHLISVECGFTVFFNIQEVEYTNHYVEGLSLEMPEVTNTLDEHIQIFVPDTIPGN